MCDCLGFFMSSWRIFWQRIYANWCSFKFQIVPADHVQLLNAASSGNLHSRSYQRLMKVSGLSRLSAEDPCTSSLGNGMCNTREQTESKVFAEKQMKKETSMLFCHMPNIGSKSIASLFTKRGQKGVNQDAMLFIEDFASRAGTIFCGVFDGHGPHGHLVARNVIDGLPMKLEASMLEVSKGPLSSLEEPVDATVKEFTTDTDIVGAWKSSLVEAYKLMDRELIMNDQLDCVSSGTTAVTLVKQGYDVILGNVGDSRAILGSTADDGSLVAIQLTVDLKPDVPREAERIRRLKGRVFALLNEPSVKRVWLPHLDSPGLAMTRALGDFCLKNYGVISEPEITHWRLSHNDKFIVLATDGVWDVLTNEQVVKTVASTPVRTFAGKAVVEAAVHAWKSKYTTSKVDDCAVVCLFLDNLADAP
ncbi:hypothetical protein L7F22_056921 [Adiantum nelumboides]|nr:hypothetical protein [Adiantum nelumboides]